MADYQHQNNFLKHLGNYNYALMQLNRTKKKEQSKFCKFLPLLLLGLSFVAFALCQIAVSIVFFVLAFSLYLHSKRQVEIENATINTYFKDFLEQTNLENVSMFDSREIAINYIMEKYSHIDKYNLELCKKHISNVFPLTGERVDSLKDKKNVERLFYRIADVEHTLLNNLNDFERE